MLNCGITDLVLRSGMGAEGCAEKDKNPKWVVEDPGDENYLQEDDDYI